MSDNAGDHIMYVSIGNFPNNEILSIYTIKNWGDWLYRDGQGKGMESFKALSENLNIPLDRMVRPLETHSANIAVVTELVGGDGVLRESRFENCDGLITNEENLALCLLQSDCVPIYYYDPEHQAIGLIHSGRRGTEQNIAGKAVEILNKTYGSTPDHILVTIGPHICGDCYEVDNKTAEVFAGCFPANIKDQIIHNKDGRITINLQEALLFQLTQKGIKREHIVLSESCTLEDEKLFSYRGGDDYLSSLSLIMLKKNHGRDLYGKAPEEAKKIMSKAASYIGMTDKPAGSNRILFNTDYYDGVVVEGERYPWCITFMWDIFRMCGLSALFYDGEKTDDCDELLEWAQKRNLLIDKEGARLGDLVVYDWNHNGQPDHAGFLWKNNQNGTYLTLEGNTSGLYNSPGGHVRFACRFEEDILAVIRPQYR